MGQEVLSALEGRLVGRYRHEVLEDLLVALFYEDRPGLLAHEVLAERLRELGYGSEKWKWEK